MRNCILSNPVDVRQWLTILCAVGSPSTLTHTLSRALCHSHNRLSSAENCFFSVPNPFVAPAHSFNQSRSVEFKSENQISVTRKLNYRTFKIDQATMRQFKDETLHKLCILPAVLFSFRRLSLVGRVPLSLPIRVCLSESESVWFEIAAAVDNKCAKR